MRITSAGWNRSMEKHTANQAAVWRTPERLPVLRGWAEDGLTREAVADHMSVSVERLSKWIRQYPEIAEALSHIPAESDYAVVQALHRKAIGFKVTVQKNVKCKTVVYEGGKKAEEREELLPVQEEIYVAPDLRAQSIWLENRMPELWHFKAQPDGENEEVQGGVVVLSAVGETPESGEAEG